MFKFLKSLFAELLARITPGRFAAPERQIFRYFDGTKFRAVDPIATFYKILEHDKYVPKIHGPLVDEGDVNATRIVCDAIRKAFDVTEWSEANGGLTVSETLTLYADFCDYLEGLKKNIEETLTLPSPTESTLTESVEPITSDTSDSGVTDTDKKSDTPTESDTLSSQPLASL